MDNVDERLDEVAQERFGKKVRRCLLHMHTPHACSVTASEPAARWPVLGGFAVDLRP